MKTTNCAVCGGIGYQRFNGEVHPCYECQAVSAEPVEILDAVEAMELTTAQRAWANIHEHHCRMAGIEPWTTPEEIEALCGVVEVVADEVE